MKVIIGIILCALGVVLGVYVGLWVCFIGGIMDIVNEINALTQSEPLNALNVAFGIAKIMFAGVCGVASAFALIIPGSAMVGSR